MRLEDNGNRNATRGDNAVSEEVTLSLDVRPINHPPAFSFFNDSLFTIAENAGNVTLSPFVKVLSLGGEEQSQLYSFSVVSVSVIESHWSTEVLMFLVHRC